MDILIKHLAEDIHEVPSYRCMKYEILWKKVAYNEEKTK